MSSLEGINGDWSAAYSAALMNAAALATQSHLKSTASTVFTPSHTAISSTFALPQVSTANSKPVISTPTLGSPLTISDILKLNGVNSSQRLGGTGSLQHCNNSLSLRPGVTPSPTHSHTSPTPSPQPPYTSTSNSGPYRPPPIKIPMMTVQEELSQTPATPLSPSGNQQGMWLGHM